MTHSRGPSDVCRGICDEPGVIDQLGVSCKGIGHTAPCNQGSSHRPDLGWALGCFTGAVLRRLSQFDTDSGPFVTCLSTSGPIQGGNFE